MSLTPPNQESEEPFMNLPINPKEFDGLEKLLKIAVNLSEKEISRLKQNPNPNEKHHIYVTRVKGYKLIYQGMLKNLLDIYDHAKTGNVSSRRSWYKSYEVKDDEEG